MCGEKRGFKQLKACRHNHGGERGGGRDMG